MTQAQYDRWIDTRTALRAMVEAFQPFKSKPMGAPNSDARLQQAAQIVAYDYAVAVLASPATPASLTSVVAKERCLKTAADRLSF